MNLINLKQVNNFQVHEWLENNIRELTVYQKESIRNDEIIRCAPFYFMEYREKTNNIFLRLSIIFILPVALILILGLPINFIVTGRWGYEMKYFNWYSKWAKACGL